MWGWEFEGRFRFTDNFSAGATLGYIDAQFNEFFRFYPAGSINPLTGAVVPVGGVTLNIASMAKLQNTPEWTMNYNATWNFEVAGGDLSLTPSASFRGDSQMFEFAAPAIDQEGYWLYDFNAQWVAPGGNWKVSLTGKNITDERYRIGGYNFPQSAGVLFGNSVVGFYGNPSTWTLGIDWKL
jgi:iron complex outermembrane receptor protein